MNITVNGQAKVLTAALTLAQLLEHIGHGQRRVAVEVNGQIVPRSQHGTYQLHENDRIEIVQAIGGG